jgi:hypothetical protein
MAHTCPSELLASLEARQDEVLRQLDDLNRRIEQTLGQWMPRREDRAAATAAAVDRLRGDCPRGPASPRHNRPGVPVEPPPRVIGGDPDGRTC